MRPVDAARSCLLGHLIAVMIGCSSDPRSPAERAEPPPHRIRTVGAAEAERFLPTMLDIEHRVYEPARRTPPEDIRAAIRDPEAIVTVAEVDVDGDWRFAGFGIGHPLEQAKDEGTDSDPMRGKHNTLYSLSVTVAPEGPRSMVSSVSSPGLAGRCTSRPLRPRDASARACSITSAADAAEGGRSGSTQRPSFSIRIGTGSKRSRSRFATTAAAEASEISCSPDRPP